MKKLLKGVLASVMAASVAMSATSMIASAAWEKSSSGTWSWTENGKKATGWKMVNGTWYYMDQNGEMQTGWVHDGKNWYYMQNSGAMTTGWVKTNNQWYYLNNWGGMATGWVKTGDTWYFMQPSGAMATGWVKSGNEWYHMDNSGAMQTGFYEVDGKTYFASAKGDMQTGVVEVDGKVYYFGEENDGAMKTGYVEIDGKLYRFGETGECTSSVKPAADVAFDTSDAGSVAPVEPTVPEKPAGGGSVIIPPSDPGTSEPETPSDTATHVKTAKEFTDALANASVNEIAIDGVIGSASEYGVYTVDRAVSIKGGTVYGSFIVKADGATFDGVTIKNKGDVSGENTEKRNAINFLGNEITIKNCTFDANSGVDGIVNGVAIFPTNTNVNYDITGNTFKGYRNSSEGYSSAGLLISGGVTNKAFFGVEGKSKLPTNVDDRAIIDGNTFMDCKNDYSRETWDPSYTVYATSNSATDNFRLEYAAASDAEFYVTGDVTCDDATVQDGSTLTVTAGNTLTVSAAITVNEGGSLVGEDGAKLVIVEGGSVTGLAKGSYTWANGTWELSADDKVEAFLTAAKGYNYSPVYTYKGSLEVTGKTVTYDCAPKDLDDPKGDEAPTNLSADMSRFFGAFYRANENNPSFDKKAALTFDGVDYTWDQSGKLKGSNWKDADGKTLISAIADTVFATDANTCTLTMEYLGVEISVKLTVSDGVFLPTEPEEEESVAVTEEEQAQIPVTLPALDENAIMTLPA